MKKKVTVISLLLVLALLGEAHEFWLRPVKFRFKPGEEMKVDFVVGEQFTGEFWDLNRHKVEKLRLFSAAGEKNLLPAVKPTKGDNLRVTLPTEGTYMLALESNDAYLEMEADKFKAYLEEDGLEYIAEERAKNQTEGNPSKEFYRRYAKLLVQAGTTPDDTYKKRAGFRYEIVPLANPYAMKTGENFSCRIYWEGRPAAHAQVKVWSQVGNRIFLQNIYTENDGSITFPISSSGPWMVSTVRMIKSEKPGADYQSLWASLVFEIR